MNPRVIVVLLAGAAVLALEPLLKLPAFYESILYLVLHWIILATSWNILSGYSGYFSFGHGAYFGTGVYTSAVLSAKFDWPFLATLPVAAGLAALLGVALGAVVFRVRSVRGELFALLTLAVTFVLATIVLNTPIDGGPGIYLSGVPIPKIAPTQPGTFYLLALAGATAALIIAYAVQHSRLGVGLFAIHDDEDAAEVMGVPTYRYKLIALAISCALAGLAGGIHALFISYVTTAEVFSITVPLTVVLMSVLGGTRHWAGPAVGATVITALLYAFTKGDLALAGKATTGAVLIAAILFMPEGIVPRLLARRRPRAGDAAAQPAAPGPAPDTAHDPPPQAVPAAVAAAARSGGAPGEVLLQARSVARSFHGVQALAGVDVQVRRGEILGLLGPNGSGKSTLINVISGHYPATAGAVQFEGREIAQLPAHRIARAGIARTYQIPRPFAHLSVRDNVAAAAMFGSAALPAAQARRDAAHWLAFAGLSAKADVLPDELNLHQRKFLELARALAARPRLVLLDEVLCGLNPAEIDEAVALVRRIRDAGTTVVFVEHVMRAVMALADRIVVLNHGLLLAEGAPADVMQRPEVMSAYLGTGAGVTAGTPTHVAPA